MLPKNHELRNILELFDRGSENQNSPGSNSICLSLGNQSWQNLH